MPRKAAKNVPGSERYRDERRNGGGARMHGRKWHDHEKPTESEGELERARYRAIPEVESSGDRSGMGARRDGTRPSQSREKRKRSVPIGKGISKRAAGARSKRSKRGGRGMTGTRAKARATDARRI
jgi:hypothetical protein